MKPLVKYSSTQSIMSLKIGPIVYATNGQPRQWSVRTLIYRWGCQFLSLFSQDNEHTELTVPLFFQNPYAILAHILQHYHDFQSNVAIFNSVVQAYTQPYSLSGRIKLIICQIRHELSVTIHEVLIEIKNVRWRTQ